MGTRTAHRIATWATVTLLVAAGCGGGGSDQKTSSATASSSVSSTAASSTGNTSSSPVPTASSGCGVTLAEVQAVLPEGTPVVEHKTPDAFRCNFTWRDGGNWGIDVLLVRGGRAAIEATDAVPGGPSTLKNGTPYEAVEGVGDTAWAVGDAGRVDVVAFLGADVAGADIVFDGTPAAGARTPLGLNADFLAVCTGLVTQALS